jgi:hypothetical protein
LYALSFSVRAVPLGEQNALQPTAPSQTLNTTQRAGSLKKSGASAPHIFGPPAVTICTQDKECLFGEVVKNEMKLSPIGEIAEKCWIDIPEHFDNVELDSWKPKKEWRFAPYFFTPLAAQSRSWDYSPERHVRSGSIY